MSTLDADTSFQELPAGSLAARIARAREQRMGSRAAQDDSADRHSNASRRRGDPPRPASGMKTDETQENSAIATKDDDIANLRAGTMILPDTAAKPAPSRNHRQTPWQTLGHAVPDALPDRDNEAMPPYPVTAQLGARATKPLSFRPITNDEEEAPDERPSRTAAESTPDAPPPAHDLPQWAVPDVAPSTHGPRLSEEMLALVVELDQTRGELEGLRLQVEKAQAELAAVRRRSERDRAESSLFASGDVISRLIPIIDDLERAGAYVPDELRNDPWVAGVLMIGQSIQAMLRAQGVERLVPYGEQFDPHRHEAVAHEIAEVTEDTITKVFRPGYLLHGRVLRPAQVQVAVRKVD